MPTVKSVTSDKGKVTSEKTAKKAEVTAEPKKPATSNQKREATGGLSVEVYTLTGNQDGSITLPKEVFGAKVNKALLSQAIRVYQSNQTGHFGNTKTRGEVDKSTRKIYKQKGTGGARHGARSAPIFVGGGIAFGPRTRNVRLELPQKMRKAALISALSAKVLEKQVAVIDGADKASGKTKQMSTWLKNSGKKSVLLVGEGTGLEAISRAVKNLVGFKYETWDSLNAIAVVQTKNLVLTKNAVAKLEERLKGGQTVKGL